MGTLGLVLMVVVTSAGLQDDAWGSVGRLLRRMAERGFRRLGVIFADGMYEGSACLWAWALGGWAMRIVKRTDGPAAGIGVRAAAQAVGRGADVRVARAIPAAEQGLRVPDPQQRDDDLPSHDQPHAQSAGTEVNHVL